MAKVTVITDALRAEGRKWRQLSDQMATVKAAAEGLELSPSAFFIGDLNVGLHSTSYDNFQSFMVHILSGAVTEFDQLGGSLYKAADAYDNADEVIALDLNELYRP
ncbi:MAG TPA: hypothetical protein VFX61_10235 [Micromonosporaceae bacterium]|nr:hypothetical protein [Micromonosporaceae bacterium]